MVLDPRHEASEGPSVGLGDFVILLLAGVLSSLSEQLRSDGFESHAELVADLVETIDDYVAVGGIDEIDR